ncbi:DUF692 domain-containing protein, partial [Curvivirga aplysinae]|uniref:DUF692 domain-containing protein n=1 Tax=Curvivirga aplysinae TaxID=2529852 RepID=UPI0012BC7F5B
STNSDEISEPEFLNALAKETGCGILLDVNNIYVSAQNTGSSIEEYLETISFSNVQEIHVAGHSPEIINGETILIDTHGDVVCDAVWDILKNVISKSGVIPVLMEWDTDIPAVDSLLEEAQKAQKILDEYGALSDVA